MIKRTLDIPLYFTCTFKSTLHCNIDIPIVYLKTLVAKVYFVRLIYQTIYMGINRCTGQKVTPLVVITIIQAINSYSYCKMSNSSECVSKMCFYTMQEVINIVKFITSKPYRYPNSQINLDIENVPNLGNF